MRNKILISLALILFGMLIPTVAYLAVQSNHTKSELDKLTEYLRHRQSYSTNVNYELILDCIHKYAAMFELDPETVKAVCIRESDMCPTLVNHNKPRLEGKNIDLGIMQVNVYYWGDAICEMDRFRGVMKDKRNVELIKKVLFDVDHNIFLGCFILKVKMLEANGSIYRAIAWYNGRKDSSYYYAEDVLKIADELRR